MADEDNNGNFPLTDAIDAAILMHREVHFGGSFDVMLDYYSKGGKGVCQEFTIERIRELQLVEAEIQKNLAALMLSGPEAERVAQSREAYKSLRDVFEKNGAKNSIPLLMAELILTEEEDPVDEIERVIAQEGDIVPALMDLLRSEDYYDPLFPGYGQAPVLAIRCLGIIGDKRAIIGLFETIGESDFFSEDIALDALYGIGDTAKEFLLHVLHARPITYDNERAAIALDRFKDDPEVAQACFKMLKSIDLNRHAVFATYLALACQGLEDKTDRQEFIALAENPKAPKMLQQDIKSIAKSW